MHENDQTTQRKLMRAIVMRSLNTTVRAGTDGYDRSRHLRRLLPVGPDEVADDSQAGRRRILRMLLGCCGEPSI